MSAAIFIGVVALLKVVLEVASVIQYHRQQAEEEARRAPVPVHAEGALPGEALAPLPESNPQLISEPSPAPMIATTTAVAKSIDPKDLFDPAEFLVVARRRATPQRDLFDTLQSNTPAVLTYPSLPDEPGEWVVDDRFAEALSVEDEIYAARMAEESEFEHPGLI